MKIMLMIGLIGVKMNTFEEVREVIDNDIHGLATDEEIIEVQNFCEEFLQNYHYLPDDIYEFYKEII